MNKRVFLIVLDSFGIGEAPDADAFGDKGANTLRSISESENFDINNLIKLGLYNIDGIDYLSDTNNPLVTYCRLQELSKGKDTTIGHWEIGGIVSHKPLPTYPDGFPDEIIDEFSKQTGRNILCNKPYSGTEVIKKYGQEHISTGDLIVYTSSDSVFQIAAHEDVVPVTTLYKYCKIARNILKGKHNVGRVIARPFTGVYPDFKRTSNRHDFSIKPSENTMLDYIKESGKDVIAVGKINDIFASQGVTQHKYTKDNADGMNITIKYSKQDFDGLCFVNLVDFDMVYGHRNDVDGYAKALSEFDLWLPYFLENMRDNDVLFITADHGCDPGFTKTTDHTREYVPLLIYGKHIKSVNLGTKRGFSCIAKTICDYLDVENNIDADSFLGEIYEQ